MHGLVPLLKIPIISQAIDGADDGGEEFAGSNSRSRRVPVRRSGMPGRSSGQIGCSAPKRRKIIAPGAMSRFVLPRACLSN